MSLENLIKQTIKETLQKNNKKTINESYVVQSPVFDLKTELLSEKNKTHHEKLLQSYTENLNKISAELDGCNKSGSNPNHSNFRNLKIDETYNHNAVFLHGLFFQNISDLNSEIATDSLPFMRLQRDFGTFDEWQNDFIACGMAARNGWVVTAYNFYLNKYVNTIIDLHSQNVMLGLYPVIVIDCWEHSFYRDYLSDKSTYIVAMMKELNWEVIDNRFKICESIRKSVEK